LRTLITQKLLKVKENESFYKFKTRSSFLCHWIYFPIKYTIPESTAMNEGIILALKLLGHVLYNRHGENSNQMWRRIPKTSD